MSFIFLRYWGLSGENQTIDQVSNLNDYANNNLNCFINNLQINQKKKKKIHSEKIDHISNCDLVYILNRLSKVWTSLGT